MEGELPEEILSLGTITAQVDYRSEKISHKFDRNMRNIPEETGDVTKGALLKFDDGDRFKHLPSVEKEILKRQVFIPEVKTGLKVLYRYATRTDQIIIAISTICAIAAGAALPLMTVIFGQLAGQFQDFFLGNLSADDFHPILTHNVLYFIYLAIGEFATIYISTVGFIYTREHISGKIRAQYLAACLRQNIAFYDKLGAGEITTRITADTNLVQDGISQKIGLTIVALATFLTAFIIGYTMFWKLTLILSSTVIAITFIMGAGSILSVKYHRKSLDCYALGGSLTEEVIASIRDTTAFGTQNKLAQQYDTYLIEAEKWGFKNKVVLGIMVGSMFLVVYLNYGLAFWQGTRFIINGETDLQSVLTIVLAMIMGAFSLSNIAPNLQAFTTAVSATAKIFDTIDRISPLDPSSDQGKRLRHVEGMLEFRHVKHIYPSRPEAVVMDDINLIIPAGKKTAIVGTSGSGKSTIIGLVERFYEPVAGQIFLDGTDITTLNLKWMRQQISLVSQEPTLFGISIFEFIRHGIIGTKMELVVEAAKMANAHEFITKLPDSYHTNVGERGFLLSGGQKQRIAIAWAVVRDPKNLLLDEATSALDTKSEGVVQAALAVATAGRTTVVVTHRLSTIKDADNIIVLAKGCIVEQGLHAELLDKKDVYFCLVQAQKFATLREMGGATHETSDPGYSKPIVGNGLGTYIAINFKLLQTSTKMQQNLCA